MKLTNQRGAVCSRRKGWTLIELLVAIGIVLLLASLGFPAAKRETHMAKGSRAFDYMVINDDLNRTVDEIIKIIHHKKAEI